MNVVSQLDPKWKDVPFPGTTYLWGNYGCLASCICMLLGKTPLELMAENKDGWDVNGNLKTSQVLAKYGYKIVSVDYAEGEALPTKRPLYIARTSFLSPTYPTHFYILKQDGSIIDPGSMYNPKAINRYKMRTNQVRYLLPLDTPIPELTIDQRVARLEAAVFK